MRHASLASALPLLTLSVGAPARADTKICVSEGKASVTHCQGATFNIHLEFADAAAQERFLATINAKYATSVDLSRFLQVLGGRLEALNERLSKEEALNAELRGRVASLDKRRNDDALLAGNLVNQLEDAKAELADHSARLAELKSEYAARDTLVWQSIQDLKRAEQLDRRRIAELDVLVTDLNRRVEHLERNALFEYKQETHRIATTVRYTFESPLGKVPARQRFTGIGIDVGYMIPGRWLVSQAFSLDSIRGSGDAIVTDPQNVVLGHTPTWRTHAVAWGTHLLLGRESGPFAAYARGGARVAFAQNHETVPFGAQSSGAAFSLPMSVGGFARFVSGLIGRVEAGFVYWPRLNFGHYVYDGPTGNATLAGPVTSWNLWFSLGVGYVISSP